MRNCPVCSIELNEEEVKNVLVDRCPQCRGIYFDHGELEMLINLVKVFNSINLTEDEIDTTSEFEGNRVLKCSADNIEMEKMEIAGTIIDICPKCKGIWLDNHEIVGLKMAEAHIKNYIKLYIRLGVE